MEQNAYIRFGWAIRHLLRNKANFSIVEGLLTVLFNDKTEIIEMPESEENRRDNAEFNIVDIKAKNSKGEIIMVEIQNMRLLHYYERILLKPDKTIIDRILPDKPYDEIKKVYLIDILYFDFGKGSDYVYHGRNPFIGIHTNDELSVTAKEESVIAQKLPGEVFPEYYLIRVNEFNQVAKTPLEEWVKYLKTGIIDPDTTTPGLSEAREKLRYYDMSPGDRYAYDEHINAIMIQNDVLSTAKMEGRIEGLEKIRREKAKYEMARNLKESGVSAEIISKATGLGMEEIVKL